MSTVDVPVYLQVEPRERGYNPETRRWDGAVTDATVVATTKTRPGKPRAGTVTVKVTLRIPAAAFDPLRPEAVVVIPTDLTDPNPVVVEASDPTDGDS
ncbi:MAG: hypothetical protein NVV70_16975 [Cellulomonas sp.]|nr:hypothetical protein [Cellulomonas sp.]MCR6649740.1 hypothetical protein [Cellulomonas sp.]